MRSVSDSAIDFISDDEGSYDFGDDSFSFREETYEHSFSFIRKKRDVGDKSTKNASTVTAVPVLTTTSRGPAVAISNGTTVRHAHWPGPVSSLGLSGIAELLGAFPTLANATSQAQAVADEDEETTASRILNGELKANYVKYLNMHNCTLPQKKLVLVAKIKHFYP